MARARAQGEEEGLVGVQARAGGPGGQVNENGGEAGWSGLLGLIL